MVYPGLEANTIDDTAVSRICQRVFPFAKLESRIHFMDAVDTLSADREEDIFLPSLSFNSIVLFSYVYSNAHAMTMLFIVRFCFVLQSLGKPQKKSFLVGRPLRGGLG